jgi:predicted ribosomally synthesized six-cysteine peptide SCIFF
MKHIRTLVAPALQTTVKYVGCTDCAVSCQSACKTSCTVGNIVCSVTSLNNPSTEQVRVHDIANR